MGYKSIAIDGPSGAGKSTLARQAAQALGYLYVDTGAIYRALGLFVRRHGADPSDPAAVVPLLNQVSIRMDHGADGLQHMYLGEEDVTGAIRHPEISRYASAVSALPQVRAFLLEMQRDLARNHDVIMDGRDIGTVVLPGADVKIFLTASPQARARRRCDELLAKGERVDYDGVLADLQARDARDSGRAAAPLRQAEDALRVDTTELDLEQSLEAILSIVRGKLEP